MKYHCLSFMLLIGLSTWLCLSSFANGTDDAKAALIKSNLGLSGKGAVVSGPMSIAEVEKESLKEASEYETSPQVPFGYDNELWKKFKSEFKAGDAIFYFKTNTASWINECGREGYALVRGSEVVDTIITKVN